MTEADLQSRIVDVAKMNGWRIYHTYDSRRSNPGFPDLCMVRGERLVFMELKADKGKVSPDQVMWLAALSMTHAEVYLVYPRHMQEVADLLSKRPPNIHTLECAYP
jgi:hypothetical protein